jgi:hypothetical protein
MRGRCHPAINAGGPLGRVIAIHNFGTGDIIDRATPGRDRPAAVRQCRGANG